MGPSLHHVGYVVPSIEAGLERWRSALQAISVSEVFDDRTQRARVVFLDFAPGGGTRLELVEPLSADSPVARFLQKGGGLHHLCYEVDGIEEQILAAREQGAMPVRAPRPAVAFGGRRIAWVMTADKLLVEYLER